MGKQVLILLFLLFAVVGAIFGFSILIYPGWLIQDKWVGNLLIKVVFGLYSLLNSGLLIFIVNKLLDIREIREWLNFHFGKKFQKLETYINDFTDNHIEIEKNSRRYIPEVFIETSNVKESLRYFSDPKRFADKITDEGYKGVYYSYFIETLRKIGYPIEISKFPSLKKYKSLDDYLKETDLILNDYSNINNIVKKDEGGLLDEEYQKIPDEIKHIYHYQIAYLDFSHSFNYKIEQTRQNIDLISSIAAIVLSPAGKGKTNLICDFTVNYLRKTNKLCLFLTGRDFNLLQKHESIEDAIARIIFPESEYKLSDIFSLIRLNKTYEFLYLVIDGINEHADLNQFELSLVQFIQRYSTKPIKIILTCRSEYFSERFGSMKELSTVSEIHLDTQRRNLSITHQEYLISQYFNQFNIPLTYTQLSKQVRDIFTIDKLLLRFFCEAHEGVKEIPYLDDVYRSDIFELYLKRKSASNKEFYDCLEEVIRYMVENSQFIDIPLRLLSDSTKKEMEKAYHENIVVRKDLIKYPGLALNTEEAINFVYDEFREYLIASYIVDLWHKERSLAELYIEQYSNAGIQISEGLQRYLYSYAIKNKNLELINLIANDEQFIDNVFNNPDNLMFPEIIHIVTDLFWSDHRYTGAIINKLILRCNPNIYPNMNISFVINQIFSMDENQYIRLIQSGLEEDSLAFFDEEHMLYRSLLSHICLSVIDAFQNNRIYEESRNNILYLLFCLCLVEKKDWESRGYGLGKYPAIQTIEIIREYYSDEEFSSAAEYCRDNISIVPLKELIENLIEE